MTLDQHLDRTRQRLRKIGVATPELDVVVLLEHATGKPREWLYAHADEVVENVLDIQSIHAYEKLIKRREQSEPVAYIVGEKEFYGLSFSVTPDVMIPRPESEALVEYALEHIPENGRLLDVGTGSGVLAIASKHTRPDLDVTATDVSSEALAIARQNARNHHVEIRFQTSDMFIGITNAFDAILANLPYVKPDAGLTTDSEYEPWIALNGKDRDGLALYRQLLRDAPEHLTQHGILVLEADPWQHPILTQHAARQELCVTAQGSFMLALETPAYTGISES